MEHPNRKENESKFSENVKIQSGNLLHLIKENKNISVLVVIFVAVVMLAVLLLNTSEKNQEVLAEVRSTQEGETVEIAVPEEVLEKDAYPEVNKVVKQYFQALVEGDMETVHQLKSYTDEEEELKMVKKSEFIEAYPSIIVHTKKGPEEGSFIAYVQYEVKFKDYDTTAPGLNTLYLCQNEEGQYYINSGELDEAAVEYLKTVSVQNDVLDLFNSVQVAYNEIKTNDKELGGFLDQLPTLLAESVTEAIEQQVAEEEAKKSEETAELPKEIVVVTKVKVTDVVNVRTSDSIEADRIGQTSKGQILELLEEKLNGWSKVKFDGKEGFIKSEFLEPEESETIVNPELSEEEQEAVLAAKEEVKKEEDAKITEGKLTDTVNIRKEPSTAGDKLGKLSKGTTIQIIERQEDGWTKIKYNDQEAYVKSDYVE